MVTLGGVGIGMEKALSPVLSRVAIDPFMKGKLMNGMFGVLLYGGYAAANFGFTFLASSYLTEKSHQLTSNLFPKG